MSKSIRFVSLGVLALSLVSATPMQFTPDIGVIASTQNPLQIAILHWYAANLTTQFSVGGHPFGMVFDGASVWVANEFSNTISKLRASDGATLGTFPVENFPDGMALTEPTSGW
jgi:hypothetical protein